MKTIVVNVPEPDLEDINKLVELKKYPNRAEFIRTAIKQVLKEELGRQPKGLIDSVRTL